MSLTYTVSDSKTGAEDSKPVTPNKTLVTSAPNLNIASKNSLNHQNHHFLPVQPISNRLDIEGRVHYDPHTYVESQSD